MTKGTAIEVMILAAWLGAAILVAAVVAPAAFRVLPSRTMAGALVGAVLPVIFISGLVVGAVVVALDVRAGAKWARPAVAAPYLALIVGCIVAQFIIGPKIESVRASIGGAVDALDAADPRRAQFGKLHGFSVLWMGVAMLGAASAIARILYDNKN